MNPQFSLMVKISLLLALGFALLGCATPKVIYKEVLVEVDVPVTVPCVTDRPDEPISLRDQFTFEEWQSLTTDQREKLVAAQALIRKVFGDRLTVATAGCQ